MDDRDTALPVARAARLLRGALLGLALSVPALPASAEIYRWTDADGVVHFTQTPPPDAGAQPVQPGRPGTMQAPSADAGQALLERAEARDAAEARALAEAQARAEQFGPLCDAARERLAFLESRPPRRITVTDDDGNVARMGVEQWERERDRASQDMSQYCG